jgi:hypothetical protein
LKDYFDDATEERPVETAPAVARFGAAGNATGSSFAMEGNFP